MIDCTSMCCQYRVTEANGLLIEQQSFSVGDSDGILLSNDFAINNTYMCSGTREKGHPQHTDSNGNGHGQHATCELVRSANTATRMFYKSSADSVVHNWYQVLANQLFTHHNWQGHCNLGGLSDQELAPNSSQFTQKDFHPYHQLQWHLCLVSCCFSFSIQHCVFLLLFFCIPKQLPTIHDHF